MRYLSFSIPGPNGQVTIEPPQGVPTGGFTNSATGSSIIQVILTFLILIVMTLAIVGVIYSGIQWITSGGDAKKIEGARNRLVYSIIGLIVVIGAFFIVKAVFTLLGIDSSPFLFI